jgi:hypothetical protein
VKKTTPNAARNLTPGLGQRSKNYYFDHSHQREHKKDQIVIDIFVGFFYSYL